MTDTQAKKYTSNSFTTEPVYLRFSFMVRTCISSRVFRDKQFGKTIVLDRQSQISALNINKTRPTFPFHS